MSKVAVKKGSLQFKAEQAFKEAFRDVVEEHKRDGRPVVIWRNGRITKVPASQFPHKRP